LTTSRYDIGGIGQAEGFPPPTVHVGVSGQGRGSRRERAMAQRRRDDNTAVTAEYAFFLAETRGLRFALDYLDNCHIPQEILLRTIERPERRRRGERRRQFRND
jgi:hypothetical protein